MTVNYMELGAGERQALKALVLCESIRESGVLRA